MKGLVALVFVTLMKLMHNHWVECESSISINNHDWKSSSVSNVNGTIYYWIGLDPMTWNDALSFCQETEESGVRGMLAEPRTTVQTDAINDVLDIIDNPGNYWIGLTNRETEPTYCWNSDGQTTDDYSNWDSGYPDSEGHCANLKDSVGHKWIDSGCETTSVDGYNFYAFCQIIL